MAGEAIRCRGGEAGSDPGRWWQAVKVGGSTAQCLRGAPRAVGPGPARGPQEGRRRPGPGLGTGISTGGNCVRSGPGTVIQAFPIGVCGVGLHERQERVMELCEVEWIVRLSWVARNSGGASNIGNVDMPERCSFGWQGG